MKQIFPFPIGTLHLIGVGGIGMSGYAEVLHHLGYDVQGSDQSENANVKRLQEMGIRVLVGHKAENIRDAQGQLCGIVVRSTAVKDTNPEVIEANAHRVPVVARVDLLSALMRDKWCINISGTHGKTTTTSMIGHMLEQTGIDPTVINGGIINAYNSNTRMGRGKWMVVESDESDGTFAHLPSVMSVITNINPEHLDHHGDFETLKEAFISYIHNLPFFGVAIACSDHPVVREILPEFHRRTLTYGLEPGADIRAVNVRTTPGGLTYEVEINQKELENFPAKITGVRLPMFGIHNVVNSLTVFAAGHEIGIAPEKIVAAVSGFSGVKRRFTTTGIVNDITVIDDYAHHPVEIAAVLRAGREALEGKGSGRLIAVVQPHRFTRLANLFEEFSSCFTLADEVIVADVYAAGEEPIPNVNKTTLARNIANTGHKSVHMLDNAAALAPLVHKLAKPGDFVICLGAGNITQWAYALPFELEKLYGIAPKNGTK
jgi:UDP-N-acetylmuramate--alanine ligase